MTPLLLHSLSTRLDRGAHALNLHAKRLGQLADRAEVRPSAVRAAAATQAVDGARVDPAIATPSGQPGTLASQVRREERFQGFGFSTARCHAGELAEKSRRFQTKRLTLALK